MKQIPTLFTGCLGMACGVSSWGLTSNGNSAEWNIGAKTNHILWTHSWNASLVRKVKGGCKLEDEPCISLLAVNFPKLGRSPNPLKVPDSDIWRRLSQSDDPYVVTPEKSELVILKDAGPTRTHLLKNDHDLGWLDDGHCRVIGDHQKHSELVGKYGHEGGWYLQAMAIFLSMNAISAFELENQVTSWSS